MNLFDFIENNEARDVRLLQLLLAASTPGCSYQQLLESLQVTPSTLAATVASLQQRLQTFNEAAQIRQCNEGKGRRIFLETKKPILFDGLYRQLLRQSKEYRILATLLEKGKCRVGDLTTELYMSKAAIFRKIKQLNHAMKPYALKIKNSTLIGSEVEIRYLYYQLVLNSYDAKQLAALAETFSVRRYIKRFEKQSQFKFSHDGEIKLSVWLGIALKRHFTSDKRFTDVSENILQQLKSDRLYQLIRNWLFEIAKKHALVLDEFEVYNIYIFMCSMEILDLSKMESSQVQKYLATALPIIHQRNQEFLTALHQIFPAFDAHVSVASQTRIHYSLNQLHHRVQFFNEKLMLLDSFDKPDVFGEALPVDVHNLQALAHRLTTIAVKDRFAFDEVAKRRFAARYYLNLLIAIHEQIAQPVRIGILIPGDWLASGGLVNRMRMALGGVCQIAIEAAETSKTYDLLVTTSELTPARMAADHLYRISKIETVYDMDQIKKLVTSIHHEKQPF
ncbi:helix-turn-helix domain-containing protein [Lacticaseibacillus chiayiensis]|uniref:helix-turn-helix domain-containing protein n=1 Tax=Lacticaseibacillus chiayiensis TaxID=2100821 RepID=UPI0010113D2B|nr:helix-turn-helix domain-containing protein [Lacticaseibacillus chiayiensis]RXT59344.1 hypothetical protein CHT97_01035 [Lacticaseibacillus chiayiensis]